MTLKIPKHMKILTLLAALFLLSAPSFVPVPSIKILLSLKYFLSLQITSCGRPWFEVLPLSRNHANTFYTLLTTDLYCRCWVCSTSEEASWSGILQMNEWMNRWVVDKHNQQSARYLWIKGCTVSIGITWHCTDEKISRKVAYRPM